MAEPECSNLSSVLVFAAVAVVWGALGACAGPSAELRRGRPGAAETGMATYYAPQLAGHRTANGEHYDPRRLTAAHPSLPFGTEVAVERTDVALPAVVVRINDRCAGGKKIIDLSEAAARRLQMMRAGIVPVRLRVIRIPGPPPRDR
jgi:rare lipoprotein A